MINPPATAIHPALGKYAAVIGLDWSHGEHACALRRTEQATTEHFRVGAKLSQLCAWLTELKDRFKGQPVALCLENHRGLLMRELARHEWIDVYAVNPATAASYRRMFTPSGDKSDERDAAALLDMLLTHAHKLHPLKARTQDACKLDELCRARVVRNAYSSALTSCVRPAGKTSPRNRTKFSRCASPNCSTPSRRPTRPFVLTQRPSAKPPAKTSVQPSSRTFREPGKCSPPGCLPPSV